MRPLVRISSVVKILSVLLIVAFLLSIGHKPVKALTTASKFSQLPSWAQPSVTSSGTVNAISPPGENALVTATSKADATAFDQAGKYAGLATGFSTLTDSKLRNYYIPETVGIKKNQVVAVEKPSDSVPVYIYRNKYDIPFIYGKTDNATAWGAGYAAAQDKLFAMDVLRHLGSGTLASLAGPSCTFEQMDYAQVSQTGYSPSQTARMINNLRTEGQTGIETYNLISSYIDGINSRIRFDLQDPTNRLPLEYSLLKQTPAFWSKGDVISVLDVISAQDGEGGGGEVQNEGLLNYLDKLLGKKGGSSAFISFKDQNDPNTPVTVNKPYPYMMVPTKINTALTANLDNPQAPLNNQIADESPGCSDAPQTRVGKEIFSMLHQDLQFPKNTSNAVLVAGKFSNSGHPIAVFGPQTGYYSPTVFMQEDLHGPNIAASGVSLAGMNFTILFGRGNNFAWSGTSSGADDEDQRVELLCNPYGGSVPADSNWYIFKNRCIKMHLYVSSENLRPTIISPGTPFNLVRNIYTTVHGVVQGYSTSDGKPVAITLQRAAENKEQLALLGLVRWENPNKTNSVSTWLVGAQKCPWALNWYYIDSSNIGYYSGGLLPIRTPGVNPNLPTWGTGVAEWKGYLTPSQHPQEINPKSGIIINWNNASAVDFSAADNDYSHGPIYRSQLLANALNKILKIHNFKIDRAQLVQAVETGGLTDMSATGLYDQVVKALGRNIPANVKSMLSVVGKWVSSGGLRQLNLPSPVSTQNQTGGLTKTSQYKYAAAIAIWDQFYPLLVTNIFDPILAGGGISSYNDMPDAYNLIPLPLVSSPNGQGVKQGDSYGGGYEGFVWRILRQMNNESVGLPFSKSVTDKVCYGGLSTCKQALLNAFSETYIQLASINKSTAISSWMSDTQSSIANQTMPNFDSIAYIAIGIAVAPNMVWQNRPTFQQVATFKTQETASFNSSILVNVSLGLLVLILFSIFYVLLITERIKFLKRS